MRLDHIVFAAGPGGLAGTTSRLAPLLGEQFVTGGIHPRFGTRNAILPLTDDTYFEVVEVLDHPASDKAPFGQAVRARSELGGGWLGWAVAVDDISAARGPARPRGRERQPAPPRRHRAALEAARRQGPPGRPAAAVLHRVERRSLAAPERRRHRRRVAGVPRDRRRPRPRLGVARPVGRRAARGRQGRVGRPQRHARASSPRSSRPPTGSSASDPAWPIPIWLRAPSRARTSGTTPQVYEVENRAVDRAGAITSLMQRLAPWEGRDLLDIGCGTGFHLPVFAAKARHRRRGRAAR